MRRKKKRRREDGEVLCGSEIVGIIGIGKKTI